MATMSQNLTDWTWTRTWRLGGVAGIIMVILVVIGFFALPAETPPVYDDPIEDIKAYFVENDTAYHLGDYISGLGFIVFFLIFLVSLTRVLRSAEGSGGLWSVLTLAGGLVAIAIAGATAIFWSTLALQAAADGNDAIVSTLMYMQFIGDAFIPLPMALVIFGSSMVIIKTGVLWKWLAWAGFPLSIAAVISPLAVMEGDPEGVFAIIGIITFVIFLAWSLAVSVGMIMKKSLSPAM